MTSPRLNRFRAVATVGAVGAPLVVGVAPASAKVLFASNYATQGLNGWAGLQQSDGVTSRLALIPGFGGQPGPVLRAEVHPGDHTTTGTYVAERAEVFGRTPVTDFGTTAAAKWPDPVGGTRWYRVTMFLRSNFEVPTDGRWVSLAQWKGLRGGSPPVAILAEKGRLMLKAPNSPKLDESDLGPATRGVWIHFVVGMRFGASASTGWLEIARDGVTKVARTATPTMEMVNSAVDPTYFKEGIYRGSGFSSTHTAYFADTVIGTERVDVDEGVPPDSPPASPPAISTPVPAAPVAPAAPSVVTGATAQPKPSAGGTGGGVAQAASLGDAPASGAAAGQPSGAAAAARKTLLTASRRGNGRLVVRVDQLLRTGSGAGSCPDTVRVRITRHGHKARSFRAHVIGNDRCRLRRPLQAQKVRKKASFTVTVTGKGYRRASARISL